MTPASTGVADYLARIRDLRRRIQTSPGAYSGIEDYVLDRGVACPVEPLTPEEEALVNRARWGYTRIPQGCFGNAQKVALRDRTNTLIYTEGYAIGGSGIPVHHGWVTINGKAVEMTWETPQSSWSYFGVPFTRTEIEAAAFLPRQRANHPIWRKGKRGDLWSIIDHPQADWPELQKPRLRPPSTPEAETGVLTSSAQTPDSGAPDLKAGALESPEQRSLRRTIDTILDEYYTSGPVCVQIKRAYETAGREVSVTPMDDRRAQLETPDGTVVGLEWAEGFGWKVTWIVPSGEAVLLDLTAPPATILATLGVPS